MKQETTEQNIFIYPIPFIRFGEFDMAGVLYHSHYFHLYENARELFMRQANLGYDQFASNDQHLAVSEAHQNFFSPLLYGHPYVLHLWAEDLKKTNVRLCYEIIDQDHKRIHTAYTKHAFVSKKGDTFRVAPFPDFLVALFQTILQQ